MTPITEINPSLLFYVKEETKVYAFSLTDLFNIIKQALTNNVEIHSLPKEVLNPYTRRPFRHESLYLFFLKVYESSMLMPNLFFRFVKAGFDLPSFHMQNEGLLREYAIKNTVDALTPGAMNNEIREMMNDIRIYDVSTTTYKTIIPNVKLLPCSSMKQFKAWLYMYYVHLYSLSPATRERCYKKLLRSMMNFVSENPSFGVVKKGVVRTEIDSPIKNLMVLQL
jgi:hypothetical protein